MSRFGLSERCIGCTRADKAHAFLKAAMTADDFNQISSRNSTCVLLDSSVGADKFARKAPGRKPGRALGCSIAADFLFDLIDGGSRSD
jgi:hypothetical protein